MSGTLVDLDVGHSPTDGSTSRTRYTTKPNQRSPSAFTLLHQIAHGLHVLGERINVLNQPLDLFFKLPVITWVDWVPGIGNSDNVPLLATPGEFVMRKAAAARFGPALQAMNSGTFKANEMRGGGTSIGSVVFNINGANLDEKAVADIAVRKMRSLDSATIRGGRF